MRHLHLFSATAFVLTMSALCAGQTVTSAKSGTLHYFQGDVSIDGADVKVKAGIFPELRPGSVLRTELGRAELLLTPGVFLRVGDNSAIRMVDANLEHTRLEVMSGTAMVESDDPRMSVKNAPVTIVSGETQIRIVKHGLVEIGADAQQVKVYRGEAEVSSGSSHITLKDGTFSPMSADLKVEKFDTKVPNDLFVWSRDRSIDLSAANMYSAGAINAGGSGYGYSSASPWSGGWFYNNMLSMYTFVPAAGMLMNPFGYGFYSPVALFESGPILSSIGRPIGGNINTAVGPSPITRLVGGTSGSQPALGSAARFGAPGPQAGSGGGFVGGRSIASSGGASGGGMHSGGGVSGGGGGAHGGGGHR